MSYYKHWSGILQKAAKGFRLQKQRPNQDSWHFQLSHCCFILAPTFLPFLTSTNNNKSVAWFFWKKWERHWNFDIFDWKLVLSSISQGQSYNQKVALFRCPSDLTNFVKICAFVQSLEVILERSDSLGWELPVVTFWFVYKFITHICTRVKRKTRTLPKQVQKEAPKSSYTLQIW